MRKKVGFKKTVAAMLAALMTFNAVNTVFAEDSVLAAEVTKEKVIQTEPREQEVTAATPVSEWEGEVIEPEINAYNKDDGKFTVTLNGGGHSICYEIYLYNVKNLEPGAGSTKEITKIGSSATPSTTEPQWKVVRIDANGSEAKSYFDLSFEQLILRHDGAYGGITQGWSGVQLKVKFNIAKHTNRIGQSVTATEQGRLCLIANESPYATNLAMQIMMVAENNDEAKVSCDEIDTVMTEHNGKNGIVGYIQCNSYNCGLADYNGDGIYSNGNLEINFGKGKETLKINPNKGVYKKKDGTTITGTSATKLTEKVCGETTAITTPTREGYTFNGWTVTHGTGGNGSYNSSTKKYTHCTTEETGVTTLKAKWIKNGTTPTPGPTATPTPIPKYTQTVKHWCWNVLENKWELKDTENESVERGDRFNPVDYVKTYDGYYKESITLQNGNPIGEYTVWSDTVVHINYKPNQSTLQVDPNGGTWNGSTEVKSFTQAYGTTLDIPEPTRDKYKFNGWDKQITNGTMSNDDATYEFGPTAGVTDCITAQWEAFKFTIKYERNEPSGIGKVPMQPQEEVSIESQDSIYDVGTYENAKFLGWCLAKGNYDKETEELKNVRWLKEDGTFAETETEKGEKRFDTTGYTGKVFENLSSVQELVPYVINNGEELTLVGMWTIDVDFDAEDGTNTEALAAGQHGIAPDVTFDLVDEAPNLMGTEFVQWINPTQQSINNAGKPFAQTGKSISVLAMESAVQLNTNGNIYKKGQTVDEGFGSDTVLSATYQYYIQYQKADETIIKQGMSVAEKKTYGETTTISDVTYPTTGNTEGHHYVSEKAWKVVSDNSERYKYADAANYPEKNYSNTYKQGETALVNRSVILRAVEEANTYTVKYHANNTAASTKSLQDWSKMKDQKLTYGQNMALTDITGSELPGYSFAGWNTKVDGTGTSFSNKESNTVKDFLTKAGTNVNEDGAVINLYAQWKANTYTITFDVNRPSVANNTHASSNAPVLNGTATMEYVWDSVIANNKIEGLNIPEASLKGWHQRFGDSLWYTQNNYKEPGTAIKTGTKLGYETLGTPGNKTIYAQWEANTYTVYYDGNGKDSGGRGVVWGEVKPQTFIYDKSSRLRENTYKKQDENFCYHDDEKLPENTYGTKHNLYASNNFTYDWLGWCDERKAEGETVKESLITKADIAIEKIWNLTEVNQGEVVLYALWNGIPNITTKEETTHFDRYEGAYLTAFDMKKLVKAYDLEQGEEPEVIVKNISYYEGTKKVKTIENPEDSYVLDTTLPEDSWEDGKYKTYTITFETADNQGTREYAIEQPEKQVVYYGKIYYNNEPIIKLYDAGTILYDRYFYLRDVETMEENKLEEELIRQINVWDKEDEAYEKDKENDLYLGRLSDEPKLEILQLTNLYKNAVGQDSCWSSQEKEQGKKLQHTIQYTDIFGKMSSKIGNMYVIDEVNDESTGNEKEKQIIRFINKEYFDTLEKESQWYKAEENRKKLEYILNKREIEGEVYELKNGEYGAQTK